MAVRPAIPHPRSASPTSKTPGAASWDGCGSGLSQRREDSLAEEMQALPGHFGVQPATERLQPK